MLFRSHVQTLRLSFSKPALCLGYIYHTLHPSFVCLGSFHNHVSSRTWVSFTSLPTESLPSVPHQPHLCSQEPLELLGPLDVYPEQGPKPAQAITVQPTPQPVPLKVLPENSRSILVASVEHQEGVRLPKEILLVQLVGAELHCGDVLVGRKENRSVRQQRAGEGPPSLWKHGPGAWGFQAPSQLERTAAVHVCLAQGARP